MEEATTEDKTLFFGKKKKGKMFVVDPLQPPLEASVADTHAHLDMFKDVPLTLARASYFGIGFICSIADPCETPQINYDRLETWQNDAQTILDGMGSSRRGLGSDKFLPKVRIAIGCHPHNAKDFDDATREHFIELLKNPLTCAIGEVGLDYHYDHSPRDVQQKVFRDHIRLAHEAGLPLLLHLREAHEDAYRIMEEEGFPEAGVLLHCFNLGFNSAKPWLDQGCQFAVGGAVTFKKSEELREAITRLPAEALMTETDAPYMTPEPMRSMPCEPAHTIFTAAKIAELKGCDAANTRHELLQCMYNNAIELLDRAPTTWQIDGLEG